METLKLQQYYFTPRNSQDLSLIETFFEALGLELKKEETDDFRLSKGEKESILRGIADFENGRTISSEEVRKKIRECLK